MAHRMIITMHSLLLFFLCINSLFGELDTRVSKVMSALRFSNLYQDGMVLQRYPESATVWGYGIITEGIEAKLDCSLKGKRLPISRSGVFTQEENIWKMELEPQNGGTSCNISVIWDDGILTLNDVLFGDVWLCAGQSNMAFKMNSIYNATEEMEEAKKYTNIRFIRVNSEAAELPDDSMDISIAHGWAQPSSPHLGGMSAICFLYAKYLYDSPYNQLKVPFGLIHSAVGGTKIESWSTQEALDTCGIEKEQTNCASPDFINCNTRLYNKMIHPLTRNTLKGVLWYQGESNVGWNIDLYNCSFPAMINSWRSEFSTHSNTNVMAPFGFVQLSTNQYESPELRTTVIRWHQTADQEHVPNYFLQKVFMAVAIDTYDEPHGIHPHYKQIVAQRLAMVAPRVAYGLPGPERGPSVRTISHDNDGTFLEIIFEFHITYDQTEISGLYYCCKDMEECDKNSNNWPEISKDRVYLLLGFILKVNTTNLDGCTGLNPLQIAYLWRQTPIKGYLAAPVYSTGTGLPWAPWKWIRPQSSG